MQLSLSELKDLIYNAGLGAELTVGACEDFSFSVAVLESLSLNAASEFLYAIECDREPTQEFIITDNKVEINSGRALFEGIYAIDLFMAEKIDKIVFNIFDCPMLLIGLGYNYDNSNFVLLSSSKLIGSINGFALSLIMGLIAYYWFDSLVLAFAISFAILISFLKLLIQYLNNS